MAFDQYTQLDIDSAELLLLQKKQSAELSRIMGELSVDGASAGNYDEDDLLDLMDSAN